MAIQLSPGAVSARLSRVSLEDQKDLSSLPERTLVPGLMSQLDRLILAQSQGCPLD